MASKIQALTVQELDARADAFEDVVIEGMTDAVRKSIERAYRNRVITAAEGDNDESVDPQGFIEFIQQYWAIFVATVLIPFMSRAMSSVSGLQFGGLADALINAMKGDPPSPSFTRDLINQPLDTEVYLQNAANRLTGIGDDLWENARDELIKGIDEGEGIDQLADRVRDAVEVSEPRARSIARTESNGAMNAVVDQTNHAISAMFGVEGGIKKEWSSTDDLRTRPTHVAADGQVVNLDDPFIVGTASLQFPSDPTGPPGETINCRCTTLTVISDELLGVTSNVPEELPMTAATMDANTNAFHLPGRHNQKKHANRYSDGIQTKGIDSAGNVVTSPMFGGGTPSTDTSVNPVVVQQRTRGDDDDTPAREIDHDALVNEYTDRLHSESSSGFTENAFTRDQVESLDHYVNKDYRAIQSALRNAAGDTGDIDDAAIVEHIDNINALIDEAGPSDARYTLYRGLGDISNALGTDDPQPGMRFKDDGFGSTTSDRFVGEFFARREEDATSGVKKRTVMHIDAPRGTRMLPVGAINQPGSSDPVGFTFEKEILLGSGVEYEVTRFERTDDPKESHKIFVRIIDDSSSFTAAVTPDEREEDYVRRIRKNGRETRATPVFFIIEVPDDDEDDVVILGDDTLSASITAGEESVMAEEVEDDLTKVDPEEPVDDGRFAAWSGVIAVEGVPTGDGRQFSHNALTWAELPMSLGWMYERAHGGMATDKVVTVGQIDTIERGEGGIIVATGKIDTLTGRGWEVARMMGTREEPGSLTGISIDADDPDRGEVEYVFPEGCNVDDAGTLLDDNDGPEDMDMKCMLPELEIYSTGRIRAATLVDIPAFVEARIYLDKPFGVMDEEVPVDEEEVLIAASYTMTLNDVPPASWFDEPTDEPDIGAITVTDEGRIFGYLAPKNVAHRGFKNKRVEVPMKNVDYGIWMNRVTIADDGRGGFTRLATGPITMDCGHAPMSGRVTGAARQKHYDNSCSVVATARVGENSRGVWIAGAVLPDVTADQVRRMMMLQLSGDWGPHREKPGHREMAGALLVPRPGFPKRSFSSMTVKNGVLTRVGVPLRFAVTESRDDTKIFGARAAADRIAASVGRDRVSRVRELAARVRGL